MVATILNAGESGKGGTGIGDVGGARVVDLQNVRGALGCDN